MIPHRLRHALARQLLRGAARLAAWLMNPPPIAADGPAVWDLVMHDACSMFPDTPARRRLLLDMRARDDLGFARYGTRLRVANGRDPLLDAVAEDLDGCAYGRQDAERLPPGARRARARMRYRQRLDLAYASAGDLVAREGR